MSINDDRQLFRFSISGGHPVADGEDGDATESMEARVAHADVGQHDIEDVRDADAIAGTDDLDRGLRQRRFPGSDRELR